MDVATAVGASGDQHLKELFERAVATVQRTFDLFGCDCLPLHTPHCWSICTLLVLFTFCHLVFPAYVLLDWMAAHTEHLCTNVCTPMLLLPLRWQAT